MSDVNQLNLLAPTSAMAQAVLNRRGFLGKAGMLGLGAAATGLMAGAAPSALAATTPAPVPGNGQLQDSVKEIITAILIAEDLASVFYYNGLIGPVIQDPNLAGTGGTATKVSASGNAGNVNYLQAALTEEISHATLARSVLGGPNNPATDPYQTFYFPAGTFATLTAFTGMLNALENAFIGAYLNAIEELAEKATIGGTTGGTYTDVDGSKYSSIQLIYTTKILASIMGVECEHRVLGRVISNTNPANNVAYEQLDGVESVYTGTASAVVALTPFLTSSTGPAYTLATALAGQGAVAIPISGPGALPPAI